MFKDINDPKLAELLQKSAIGVLLTDTVYGVVCRAADPQAVAKLYKLKQREGKPGTLVAAHAEQLEALGLKHAYLKAVEQFWPGPVSVVIPTSNPDLDYLRLGVPSLAVRLSADPKLNQLIQLVGPLLTSSANPPGLAPAETISAAQDYFGDSIDFYVDGGSSAGRQPSAVIRVVDDAVEVLRPGPGFPA